MPKKPYDEDNRGNRNPANVAVGSTTVTGQPGTYNPPVILTRHLDPSTGQWVNQFGSTWDDSGGATPHYASAPDVPAPKTAAPAAAPTTTDSSGGPPLQPLPAGPAEQWFGKHGDEFTTPGPAQGYWGGVQGFFNSPDPSVATGRNVSDIMYNTPSATETYGDMYLKSGDFFNPGASESFFDNTKGFYTTPGAMESLYGDIKGQVLGPGTNVLTDRSGRVQDSIDKANTLENFFLKTLGNVGDKGYTEKMAGQYRPEASYSEQFLTGGGATGGLDKVYSRLQELQDRSIDERAAAGGAYNSGAALRARQESMRDLDTQHVRDIQTASTAADVAKIARLAEGRNLMEGADTSMRGRTALGYQGARGVDDVALARSDAMQKLYTGMSGEQRDKFKLAGDLADMSQDDALARILGGQGSSHTAQGDAIARITAGMDTAGKFTEARRQRLLDTVDLSAGASKREMDRITGAAPLVTAASTEKQLGLTGGVNAANIAEGARRNRMNDPINQSIDLANAKAGTYTTGTTAASNEQTQLFIEQINDLLKKGSTDATAQAQIGNLVLELGKMGMSAADLGLRAKYGANGKLTYEKTTP